MQNKKLIHKPTATRRQSKSKLKKIKKNQRGRVWGVQNKNKKYISPPQPGGNQNTNKNKQN